MNRHSWHQYLHRHLFNYRIPGGLAVIVAALLAPAMASGKSAEDPPKGRAWDASKGALVQTTASSGAEFGARGPSTQRKKVERSQAEASKPQASRPRSPSVEAGVTGSKPRKPRADEDGHRSAAPGVAEPGGLHRSAKGEQIVLPRGPAIKPAPRPEERERLARLGAMSIGLPNTGYLVNGVRMPEGDDWVITMPSHAYGTEETVRQLSQCISATRATFKDSPRVMLGSLSAATGGKLPPHKSHRTGRDADVYFFRKPGATWSKAATRQDIDLPRTWSLLRCFVTQADVDMVLIDRRVQSWLVSYALSIGEPPEWVDELFNDRPHTKSAIVRHVPGHVAHMHVRFVSAHARHLGVRNYKALVGAGLLQEGVEEVRHKVVKGDTLLGLAKRYKLTATEIASLNHLEGTLIRLGQVLLVKQGVPVEGIDAPIYGHRRVLPPEPCEPGPKACHAGLALKNRSHVGAVVGEPALEDGAILSASLQ